MHLNKGHAKRIFDWCKQNYGRSRYAKTYPYISIKKFKDYDEEDLDGYYEPSENCLYINSDILSTGDLEYLVETIIEEYTHYTQSDYQYQKLADSYDYDDHPYEIDAKRISSRDKKLCINYLKLFHKNFI